MKRILSKQLYHEGTKIDCITYSLFIGHSDIIANPTHRTLIDLKDRVFRSADQQWSSIQASMHYLDQQDPPRGAPLTLEDADKKLRDLLAELLENNVDWSQIDK